MRVADVSGLVDFMAALDGVYDAPPPEGDPVDLLAHGLQCAYVLRERHPDDVGLQLAGLVHDIGHADDAGDPDHAAVSARLVRPVLGDRVAELVGLHVAAKRYLAATEAYDLSPASALSLARQGDAMSESQCRDFEALPNARDAVELRRADEAAKVVGRAVPGLADWAPRLRAYAG